MKRICLTILLMATLCVGGNAQDIFKEILHNAKTVANDPNSNVSIAQVATFKVTALQYIQETAFRVKDTLTVKFFDDQAYCMQQFVNSFLQDVLVNTTLTNKQKKDEVVFYMNASCSNPLFNDPDTGLTLSYVNDSKHQLTPFSLDTDWTKAYAAILDHKRQKDNPAK